MTRQPDETGQLTSLLRTLPAPAPSAEFLAAARRRYLEAIEARDRRHVLIGLVAALVGLAVVTALLGSVVGPVALVAWLAEAAANLARWTTAGSVVVALVPLPIWASVVLGSAVAALSLVLIARTPGLRVVK